MAKFYNEEMEEVEGFTQADLDAKIAEATEAAKKEAGSSATELETKLKELEEAKNKAELKLTKRSEEYNNLKKAFDETGAKLNSTANERKEAYEKLRDSMIAKAAGDDKEYAEKLAERYEKFGEETLDPTVLEKNLKDAHTLALQDLNRDVTSFSLSTAVTTGKTPESGTNKKPTDFTETEEGKASLAMAQAAIGQKTSAAEEDNF